MREPRELFDSPRFDNARANQQTSHDLKEAGGHLIAVCKKCLHRAELKPDELIEILGWDHVVRHAQSVALRQMQFARISQRA